MQISRAHCGPGVYLLNQGSFAGVKPSSASLCWLRIKLGEIYVCVLSVLYNCRRNGLPWKLTNLPILNLDALHMPKYF